MPNIRMQHSPNGKYYISRCAFRTVYNYCLMFHEWEAEYHNSVGLRSTHSDGGSGTPGDPTASQAMRLKDIGERIELIRQTAYETEPLLYPYLLDAVTTEGLTFDMLKARGMPCERDMYYDRRRRFYWQMSKHLNL